MASSMLISRWLPRRLNSCWPGPDLALARGCPRLKMLRQDCCPPPFLYLEAAASPGPAEAFLSGAGLSRTVWKVTECCLTEFPLLSVFCPPALAAVCTGSTWDTGSETMCRRSVSRNTVLEPVAGLGTATDRGRGRLGLGFTRSST